MGKGRAGRQDAHAGHTFKAEQSLETDMLDAPANVSFASKFQSLLAFAAAKIVLAPTALGLRLLAREIHVLVGLMPLKFG